MAFAIINVENINNFILILNILFFELQNFPNIFNINLLKHKSFPTFEVSVAFRSI